MRFYFYFYFSLHQFNLFHCWCHVRMQLVKKERASAVEAMIVNMALQGSMDTKINEGKLIEMLEGIVGAQQQKNADAGKINIQRKKYNFDSDDDDDNDDDLL